MAAPDIASALFGRTRRNVLSLLFGQPDRSFYLREIYAHSGGGMSQIQKELEQLAAAGLVLRERRANQVHFRANPDAPVYAELQGIVAKTFGIADVLRGALAAHAEAIKLAFIYGSIAKGNAVAASDIDLLIVGDVRLSQLAEALAAAETRLGRRISPVVYSRDEFAALVKDARHFLTAVLAGPRIPLIGDEATLDELRRPAKSRSRKATRG
jgi:uncharacterized protein